MGNWKLNDPTTEATAYIRRLVAGDPIMYTKDGSALVVNIENINPITMVLDLDDGTTIRIDVERYTRET